MSTAIGSIAVILLPLNSLNPYADTRPPRPETDVEVAINKAHLGTRGRVPGGRH